MAMPYSKWSNFILVFVFASTMSACSTIQTPTPVSEVEEPASIRIIQYAIEDGVPIGEISNQDVMKPNGSAISAGSDKYDTVMVHFATNRQLIVKGNKSEYGTEPGDLTYGNCYVSIPRTHSIGDLESPSIWRWEFLENPEKHIVVLTTKRTDREQFFTDLKSQISKTKGSNTFVFVHGFNVTFENAARRTAQMAYDLNFDGVPVFFSWPSQGSLPSYTVDERNIEWAEADLKSFLIDFFRNSKANNIYVIGHSMGTRALTRALASIATEEPEIRDRLKGIILAAPDIDAVVFKRDIASKLIQAGSNVTLYASSNDNALKASKKIHGYSRAGESGNGLVVIDGMDTIDASNVDTSLIGHSYYGDSRSIINDMHYLVQSQLPVSKRAGLSSVGKVPNMHWLLRP